MAERVELELRPAAEAVHRCRREVRARLALERYCLLFRLTHGADVADDVVVGVEEEALSMAARIGDVCLCDCPGRPKCIGELRRRCSAGCRLRRDPSVRICVAQEGDALWIGDR